MAVFQKVLSGNSNYRLDLTVNQSSQNVANNTSSVSYSLVVHKLAGSGYWANDPSSWSVNIGGQTASGSLASYDFRNKTSITLKSGSFTITHNSDGTKSISVSGSFSASGAIGSATASGTLALTTIPRASSFGTISGSTMGSPITVNINRASSSFTHSMWYSFGGVTWQGIGSGIGTSVTFTPPLTLGNQIPNSSSGTLTLILRTMNGSTQIGQDITKPINLSFPQNILPNPGTLSASQGNSNPAGTYVQGFSSVSLSLSGHSGAYGSTIKSVSISGAGHTINGTSGTTGVLNSINNVQFTATITDSRSRSSYAYVTVNFLPYSPPQIVSASIQRTNASGVATWNGTYMKYTYHVKVASLMVGGVQKNNVKIVYFDYGANGTNWGNATHTTVIEASGNKTYGTISVTSSVPARINAYDNMGRYATWTGQVSAGTVALDIGDDNIGVGKFWERGTIDASGQIYQNNGQLAAGLKSADGYWGLTTQSGEDNRFIRTPSTGLIPHSSNNPVGVSSIGTTGWPFASMYSRQFFGKGVAGNWLTGAQNKAMIINDVQGASGSYHPILQITTPNGNVANIGHINEEFGIYGYKSGRTENGVDYQFITFNPSNGQIKINGSVLADYIVEEGEKWQRWASGKMECWGNSSGTTDASGDFAVTFPKAFTGNIDVYITERWNSTPAWKGTPHGQSNTGFKVRCFQLSNGAAYGAGVSHTVWWSARGTWK